MSLSELFFVGVLSLIIFGPRKLAVIAPEVGKTLARLKAMSGEFKSEMNTKFSGSVNDSAGGEELAADAILH